MFKKVISQILALSVIISIFQLQITALTSRFSHSESYLNSEYYKKLTAVSLVDDSATNIVNIAKSQLGYHEGNRISDMDGTNPTGNADYCEYNYNIHSGANLPWCTSFVSWCAIQAGEGNAVPKTGSTGDIYSYVIKAGGKKISASEVKAGDLVFYKVTSSGSFCHIGIMTGATTSVEGNYSNAVKSCKPATYIGTNGNTVANGKITVLYLRPAYSKITAAPSNVSVSTDKAEYNLNEKITIKATAVNASHFTLTVTVGNTENPIIQKNNWSGAPETIKPSKTGKYTVKVTAFNKVGSAASSCTFNVKNTKNSGFSDVDKNKYYYDAVNWAAENGIANGTGANRFSPDAVCTRAQAVTFLWRAAGCPLPKSTVISFDDVDPEKYYYEAVQWAFEQGITDGTGATAFSPDAQCSRAHIITFIYRMHNAQTDNTKTPFNDVSPNSYYAAPIAWAVSNGITNGSSNTTFSPNDGCTRAQIVTFLYRYLK